jgi:hypothetical protein
VTHTDKAAGRLLEVAGDGHPRQMTISCFTTLGTCQGRNTRTQNSAYGLTSSSPPEISGGLLVLTIGAGYLFPSFGLMEM